MSARRRGIAGALPTAALAVGLLFLYAPIAWLVVFSFNRSALVAVWGGASARWYGALARDGAVLHAAAQSLLLAAGSAGIALAVGVPAALALARFGPFRGRTAFAALLSAPLAMPDIIIGISLLLLFTALETATGWPQGRGLGTAIAGHATLGASYVAVVVRSRLAGFDRSVEEAAQDLGAGHVATFALVTLPLLAPALASAFLLAFSLSLDDVVIASFLTGPGSTTLPILVMSRVRLGVNPEINALATVFVGLVALVAGAGTLAGRVRNRPGRDDVSGSP